MLMRSDHIITIFVCNVMKVNRNIDEKGMGQGRQAHKINFPLRWSALVHGQIKT